MPWWAVLLIVLAVLLVIVALVLVVLWLIWRYKTTGHKTNRVRYIPEQAMAIA